MFSPYFGEFLVSPVPVELSLNYCSHKCAYCFANLNKPDRKADIGAIDRFLSTYNNRETLVARLVREGYPVLFSNRVDPFAASNYRQSLPLLEKMAALEIPVAIQTRGGFGVQEAMDLLPSSVWYISICQLDDTIRKSIEPGAPAIEDRFTLISKLVERGHKVVLGLNPLVEEWLPEPEPLLDRAKELGASGVWVERMHLNYTQGDNLSEREKNALTLPVIKTSMHLASTPRVLSHLARAEAHARSIGLATFYIGQSTGSNYWAPFTDTYPKLFPTVQEWVNHCEATDAFLVSFTEFAEFLCPRLPQGTLTLDSYLGATSRQLWREMKIPKQMTYRQLLGILWTEYRARACPARMPCFAYAWDGDIPLVADEDGLPLMIYCGEPGTDQWDEDIGDWS